MIQRQLGKIIRKNIDKIPVIAILGPRQSGKTTLAQTLFPDYKYCNLEDYTNREFAINDPYGFLKKYAEGVILDEVQNVPEIFSYIQVKVDKTRENGKFILTGSQNFQLLKSIKQSLAGRILNFTLLPLTIKELKNSKENYLIYEKYIFKGFYPRIYDKKIDPQIWLKSYIQTYIERDIENIVDINNLFLFQKFLKLCAGRIGQPINYTSLSNDAGISDKTAKRWLSLLETSYIIYSLFPYYKNFSKRITKSPKLYFYDVGLASNLLGIKSVEDIQNHYLKGGLFENLIIMELIKTEYNAGNILNAFYWKDNTNKEVDLIIEYQDKLIPIEIKSGQTFNYSFLDNLKYFMDLAKNQLKNPTLVYGGDNSIRGNIKVINWKDIDSILTF